MSQALLTELRELLGPAHVLTDGDLSAWERDWRKRYHGKALAVVRPGSTEEVAAVVQACGLHDVSIVPQGGNTGLVGGGVPDDSGRQVLLSLSRMNRVRAIDPANLTMTVDAGCILQQVQQAADDAGLLFPLSLAAEGSCTIGGNLSTNAGGTQVLRYGNARELCLGLEVVTAAGEVWDGLSGLRKDNTGYDLRDLFIGSEGTLGIITGATLKLYPRPVGRRTALAAARNLDQAVALLELARRHLDAGLTGFEVMSAFSLQLVGKHFPQIPNPFPPRPGPSCWNWWPATMPRPRPPWSRCWPGAGTGADRRRGGGRKPGPIPGPVAPARVDLAGPERGRPEHQARHLAAGVGHPGLRRPDRCRPAGAGARRAAGELRPPGRRQPALQRPGPEGDSAPPSWRPMKRLSTRWSTTRSAVSVARSRPSTALARSSASNCRSTSRRWPCA
jgi:UDP-N-acetylenolpyruvoylglucosamine reductase